MTNTITAREIRKLLQLEPHLIEGGWFRETYRSGHRLPPGALASHHEERSLGTAIYYLLDSEAVSAMHRLPGDEIFHFYLGDPVEMLQLHPDGRAEVVRLGTDLAGGERPQATVPGGTWQGSRLVPGGRVALLGTTMAPGFDVADYETGAREDLLSRWPSEAERIRALTPSR